MALTLAFVMDPVDAVNVESDTTFAFMLAAQQRGHRVVYVPPQGLDLVHNELCLRGWQVRLQATAGAPVRERAELLLWARDCDAIFVRSDPPFDADYLTVTWLLSFAEERGVRVINSPRGLRSANEKLYALEFPELCPETLVSASLATIRDFMERLGTDLVAKPIDRHGGFGVFLLRAGDSNVNAIVDYLTDEGARPIIVQRFLPEVAEGDRRLLFVGGALLGVVSRVPATGDHRGNVHVGGKAVAAELTEHDHLIAERIGPRLVQDGLFFVGLDVIGDRLIEVNVTSPTLVQELRRLGGPDLAHELIAALEKAPSGRPAG